MLMDKRTIPEEIEMDKELMSEIVTTLVGDVGEDKEEEEKGDWYIDDGGAEWLFESDDMVLLVKCSEVKG